MLLLLIGAFGVVSCAGQYREPSGGNEALLLNRPAGMASSMISRKLLTNIEKIDRQATGWAMPAFEQYKVSPGRHVITVTGISRRDTSMVDIECDFKAGQRYFLSAYTESSAGKLSHIYEIEDSRNQLAARKQARVVYTDRQPAPIFIPVGGN